MTKSTFKEAENAEEKYTVGDWFISGNDLCVLAQHRSGMCQMICIDETDANRLNWNEFNHNGHRYKEIPASEITNLLETDNWQKVSVEIIVKK